MLNFKDYIKPNIGLFFRHKNTIDVFVEDAYDEEFYLAVINRIFSKTGHSINKLIPLGNKKNVLNACACDQHKRGVKRLYIVDGDLELVTDKNEKLFKYLFVLEKYCIENYLFDEDSILEILHDYLVIDKEHIRKKLNYENWLKGISRNLIELFLHYSIAKEVCPTKPTVALGVGNLCDTVKKIPVLNDVKCNSRIENIKQNILEEITEEDYNDRIYQLRQKWPYTIESLLTVVSGKDYLMPLLEFRFHALKSKNSINIRRETLRLRLAKICNLEELTKISKFI